MIMLVWGKDLSPSLPEPDHRVRVGAFWSAHRMDELKLHEHTLATETPAREPDAAFTLPLAGNTYPRRYPRTKCFLAVQLKSETDQGVLLGNLSDVSLGGCSVECACALATGVPIALCPLAAEGELWVKGVVVNTRLSEGLGSFCMGVKFLENDPAAAENSPKELVRFVEEAIAKQGTQSTYLDGLKA
jgi:hypothetical protein